MKKIFAIALASLMMLSALAGCSSAPAGEPAAPDAAAPASGTPASGAAPSEAPASDFDASNPISVISREPGSGTRGAFIELFGIEEKGEDGTKVDRTTEEATIANQTNVVMTTVAGDPYAIGYISLGSLNDTVKAVKIDGAEATAANVASGVYKVARPFNVAVKGEASGIAKDFLDFIMSAEGQQIIEDNGYIRAAADAAAYAGGKPEGKIVVAGSSSVSPVMEKLKEAYTALNPAAVIEIQTSDSTSGMTAAMDGTCDIGMASRELKDEEAAALSATVIANDGIAVVVAPGNPVGDLTSAQVKEIFTGAATAWSAVAG